MPGRRQGPAQHAFDLGGGIAREQQFGLGGGQNPESHKGILGFTRAEKHSGVLEQGMRFPGKLGIFGVDDAVQPMAGQRQDPRPRPAGRPAR